MERTDISPSKIHILALPLALKGHLTPLLHFCNRLASKGFKITLVITVSMYKNVKAEAINSLINIESIPVAIDLEDKSNAWDMEASYVKIKASSMENMTELIEKHKTSDYPPKVLIYDSHMPWMLDVAQGLGLLGASFFTQSCSVSAVYYHMSGGTVKTPPDEPTVSLPQLPPLENNDLPSFDVFREFKEFMANISYSQFLNIDKVDYILFNTFDKLEIEVANWIARKWSILTVGPTAPLMILDKEQKDKNEGGNYLFETNADICLKWLNKQETNSVIYVSYGSFASLTEEQTKQVAEGLMRSNSKFLWVVRNEEEGKLPKDFKSEASEKGLIINWCHQLNVLAHRAVACFVTHCGWNSTLEALGSGVPMIAVPQMGDQTTNAKFIADVWEVGVRAKFNENGIVTKEEIENCIREVTETEKGKGMRRNAIKWKELAKEAVSEGGSSYRNIEKFTSSLLSH